MVWEVDISGFYAALTRYEIDHGYRTDWPKTVVDKL